MLHAKIQGQSPIVYISSLILIDAFHDQLSVVIILYIHYNKLLYRLEAIRIMYLASIVVIVLRHFLLVMIMCADIECNFHFEIQDRHNFIPLLRRLFVCSCFRLWYEYVPQ